jgi:hypothetical protein
MDVSSNSSNNKMMANNKIHNSYGIKNSMLHNKINDNLTERNFIKPNNQNIDKANYLKNDNKIFNKMKFKHFNYETGTGRSYYV